MAFEKKVVEGIRWFAGARAISQLFEFVIVTIALMNLLDPKDFGRVGMVTVITGFALMLADLGFSAALIQKKDLEARHLTAVFWTNIGIGVFLGFLIFFASPWIAYFYEDPILENIAKVSALLFLVAPLNTVQNAWLTRELEFRKISIAEMTATILSGLLALAFALLGFGVWAIVAKLVSERVILAAVMWPMSKFRPSLNFDSSALRELFNYGANLTAFSIVNYFSRQLDDFLIGKFFGSTSLGYYERAYAIMLMPIKQISAVVGRIMFPAMAKVQHDAEKLRTIYIDSNAAIAVLSFPILAYLYVASALLVEVIFGTKWLGMVPLLQIFCFVGAVQSIGTTVGWIYQSKGRTDLMFKYGLFASAVMVFAILIGVSRGSALEVAGAYAIAVGVLIIPQIWIPSRLIQLNPLRLLEVLFWPVLLSSVAAYSTHYFLKSEIEISHSILLFALSIALYLVVYIGSLAIIRPKGLHALRAMFFSKD